MSESKLEAVAHLSMDLLYGIETQGWEFYVADFEREVYSCLNVNHPVSDVAEISNGPEEVEPKHKGISFEKIQLIPINSEMVQILARITKLQEICVKVEMIRMRPLLNLRYRISVLNTEYETASKYIADDAFLNRNSNKSSKCCAIPAPLPNISQLSKMLSAINVADFQTDLSSAHGNKKKSQYFLSDEISNKLSGMYY
eukprot:NODE_253_length_12805_cov_0.273413.p5 type:complete len:199 gc:universal NODE_253_length_12805_cov_0.273413:10054-10650(+)